MIEQFLQTIDFHLGNCFSPKTIFEIGSRDAEQALEFARKWPLSCVYAFEPNPDAIADCRRRAAKEPRIKVIRMAVCEHTGAATLHASTTANVGYSSLYKPSGLYDHVEVMPTRDVEVKCIRLDHFIGLEKCAPPEVVWMDCQGSELSALRSMGSHLLRVRAIWCELLYDHLYLEQPLAGEIISFLTSFGFSKEYEGVAMRDTSGKPWFGDGCFINSIYRKA